ncbi:MAG: nucleotidyltransferase family protein [Methanobacteriaceae archaeon]|nr:nucleotidyltransferase family protein [Methanobacteriaceae archaeon]
MIGISADFDPVHKGHAKLIEKARELADKKGSEVVIYLNKGYSANHAPFFSSFEARSRMALEAGADKIVPIEGLHHRLTLAYTVPIRIAMMIEDGVRDYVDAADISTPRVEKLSAEYARKGIFSGIPRNLPNRNVIRWFAVNDFLYKKYHRKMKFHIIPEYKMDGEKISGRNIRQEILRNQLTIPKNIKRLLPDSTVEILEQEFENHHLPGERNMDVLTQRLNNYSRSKLLNIAHINADAADELVKGRKYRLENQIWASLRKAGYGPVLSRLATSAAEEDVTKQEVFQLIRDYEKEGIIPPDMTTGKVIERAWFVASKANEGLASSEAHKMFRKGKTIRDPPLYTLDGGLHLRTFEVDSIKAGMEAELFVDKRGAIACQIRAPDRKIKSPLKLPAKFATYLRLLVDSQFIPLKAQIVKKKEGFRVRISITK